MKEDLLAPTARTLAAGPCKEAEGVRYSSRRLFEHAPLAQSAERLHGKEKVYGSIP
jgi:hypothetical protein